MGKSSPTEVTILKVKFLEFYKTHIQRLASHGPSPEAKGRPGIQDWKINSLVRLEN